MDAYSMRRLVGAFVIVGLCPGVAHAEPIGYLYHQTSAAFPGVFVELSILIDGGFADLPTIGSQAIPFDDWDQPIAFGHLLAFDLHTNAIGKIGGPPPANRYTLADFYRPH